MNSFGAGGVSIGSHRVVTINLPRIAYESEDTETYMKKLEYTITVAQDILDIHRSLLVDVISRGRLPLYKHGIMDLKKQFSTIGFIGANEACEILGMDITTEEGSQFVRDILNKMDTMNKSRTIVDGHIRNIEQIPGESTAPMFAKKDKLLYDHHYKMYANQYIPLWKNVDIHQRIRAQGQFDSLCSGGAILHANVNESLTPEQMQAIIEYSAKCGVIYMGINIVQVRCNSCGKLFIGKFDKSPCHDADVTHYLRVVGFLTPVSNWNSDRRKEYPTRQIYSNGQLSVDSFEAA